MDPSDNIEVGSLEEAHEAIYRLGWTDGLPAIPPTAPLVEAVLKYLGRDPDEVIGQVPPKNRVATVEKVAVNCVMAGCLPQYAPVVIAALEAMLDNAFNLNGVQATTNCVSPLAIVSGPAVQRLGFNSGDNVFGGGSRANAAVGRAIRLILWNLGGGYPGEIDRATLGHPGKYTFCIAEDGPGNPWESCHREQGFLEEASCVTMFACEAPHHIATGSGVRRARQRRPGGAGRWHCGFGQRPDERRGTGVVGHGAHDGAEAGPRGLRPGPGAAGAAGLGP